MRGLVILSVNGAITHGCRRLIPSKYIIFFVTRLPVVEHACQAILGHTTKNCVYIV